MSQNPIPPDAPEPAYEVRDSRVRATELKFLVEPGQAADIVGWARDRLIADPHGSGPEGDVYQTSTLYFDTNEFDVYRREGSFGRAKYRIRRYDTSDVVFLERKMRTRRLLSKRRSIIGLEELDRLLDTPVDQQWAGAWFARRLASRQLRPTCQIRYERTARVLATPYGLARLTVDQRIQTWPITTPHYVGGEGTPVLPDQAVVELKFRFVMPAALKAVVETFAIQPRRLSKYRTAVSVLGLADDAVAAAAAAAGKGQEEANT